MRLLLIFARAYPWRSAAVVALLVVATLVTGFGTATLLPTLAVIAGGGTVSTEPSALETRVLDALQAVGLEPTLGVLVAVMIAMAIARAALVVPTNRAIGNAVARVARDLRIRLIRAITRARWSYLTRQRVGALSAAFASEADRAAGAYLAAATLCARALQVALVVVLAAWVSLEVTLGGLAIGLGIGLALVSFVRAARRAGAKQTRITREALSRLQSTFVSLKPLKAMAQEEALGTRLDRDSERLFRTVKRLVMTRETLRALQETMVAITVAVLAYVVLQRLEMPFQSMIVLLFLFVRMLAGVGKIQRGLQELGALESAYFALIESAESAEAAAEPAGAAAAPPERLERGVDLDRVTVSYEGTPVLRDLSLHIPAGRITALRGPSGCGKTTVADLVCGLLQPERGEVRVDGVPLRELDLHAWRRDLGYVAQDTFLFGGSVARNVAQDDPRVGAEEIRTALATAQALETFEAMPEGLETRVGMGGARLSGGQRQRVAIARALAHRPALLILDEATSALDPETETALYRALAARERGTTVLAISHQDALLEVADRVYTFDEHGALCGDTGSSPEGVAPLAVCAPAAETP